MTGECHHIGMFSQNPKKLIAFYTEKLGFDLVDSKTISKDWMTQIFGLAAACQLIKLRFDSAILEIFVPQSGAGELKNRISSSGGYNHWALGVKDKEAFVRELEKKGVSLLKLEGKGRFIYFVKDPEENLIEIYQKQEVE
jgi:catechol 2,3-dioxygenase-like lactoylglutathione lyase family enzyme